MDHIKFPSIESYKNTVKSIRKYCDFKNIQSYGTVDYVGNIKLHGTNAAYVLSKTEGSYYQSRERILSLQFDNAGFFVFCENHKAELEALASNFEFSNYCAIYGEFCGPGINSGVAINQLPKKMFYIFAVKVDDKFLDDSALLKLKPSEDIRIICQDVPPIKITIDFDEPSKFTEAMEAYTAKVEAECPIGKFHGISGVGEGVVYVPVDQEKRNISDLWFKVKGEKHSASKTNTGAKLNTPDLKTVNELCDNLVTEARLKQGLEYLKEMNIELSQKSTGDYLRWVMNDIQKEDTDVIIKSGLGWKAVQGHLANKARKFYLENC